MKPQNKAKYSLNWAKSVVEALERKHARATDYVCKLFDLTPKQLAIYLAFGDPLFNSLREIIKIYDNWMTKGWKEEYNYTDVKWNTQKFCKYEKERLLERLKSLEACGKFKELGIKAEASGGAQATTLASFDSSRAEGAGTRHVWIQGDLFGEFDPQRGIQEGLEHAPEGGGSR